MTIATTRQASSLLAAKSRSGAFSRRPTCRNPTRLRGVDPSSVVFAFALDQWRRQAGLVALICTFFLVQTLADILIPLYAGRLVDAISSGHQDSAGARRETLLAAATMVGLALLTVAARHVAFLGVARFTLRIMTQVARETFWRVQRFSTDWHANSFAGSTVRKITRGIWAFDMFNDTVLIALLGRSGCSPARRCFSGGTGR